MYIINKALIDILSLEYIYNAMDQKEYNQKYYATNKPAISKRNREYYENNKQFFCTYNREYYIKNKEAKLEYNKVKIKCSCGCNISRTNLARHVGSEKHLKLLKQSSAVELNISSLHNQLQKMADLIS